MAVSNSNEIPIQQAIIGQLISEMVTGRIAGVQAVGATWLNDTKVFPYICVQPLSGTEKIEANRRKRNTIDYVIGLAYKSTISIEDAYSNMFALMDNGQGFGLKAILRDPTLYSWGNLATYSTIAEYQYSDNLTTDNASLTTFVAYGTIRYQAVQMMYWDGPII